MSKTKHTKRMALHEISANHILGRNAKLTLQGPSSIVHTTASVINASRDLYSALCCENASIEEIRSLLAKKNSAAKTFYEITGVKWRL